MSPEERSKVEYLVAAAAHNEAVYLEKFKKTILEIDKDNPDPKAADKAVKILQRAQNWSEIREKLFALSLLEKDYELRGEDEDVS